MKNKILILIIGILIGAILASGGFLIYQNVKGDSKSTDNEFEEMKNGNGGPMMGNPPDMNNDGSDTNSNNANIRGKGNKGGQKPSMNNNDENNMGEPPAMPDNANDNQQQPSSTTNSNT